MKRLRDAWQVLTGRAELAAPVTVNGVPVEIAGISRGHIFTSPGVTLGRTTFHDMAYTPEQESWIFAALDDDRPVRIVVPDYRTIDPEES